MLNHSAFAHTCLFWEYHTPRNAVPVLLRTVKIKAFPHSCHVQKRNVGGIRITSLMEVKNIV
jgi:hypothetical protein